MSSTTVNLSKVGMTNQTAASPRKLAKVAGVLYLLVFFIGPLAFFMGRTSVVVPGDPAATVETLMASEPMYRLGMVAETVIVFVEIVMSAILYVLFRPVSRSLSLAAALARFAQSVLQAVNLLTAAPALLLLGGAGYLAAFEPDQFNALVLLFADINAFMIIIWGLIFGFHLVLLGTLVYKSSYFPKVLGILLMIGAAGYLAQSYGHMLVPQYDDILSTVVILLSIPGELMFTVYLLWKGLNLERWEERAHEAR